ncbi:MAG TPA: helix-hairpin-helix domain-containing protein [Flavipsychrobacter sp.]|nr:helix-hairpin-helix domain-containing protein [Flavipsychrobacter sp.]
MTNSEIADYFSLLSKLMDIHGENSFKSKSYSITAFNIENLPVEIETMSDAELFSVKGIGDATGQKIKEIIQTGKLSLLEKLLATTPPGILEMLQIKGLGPKKIAVVWKELGIESLGELEYACNENRLASLKGFGQKTQESISKSIAYYRQNQGYHLWAEVESFAIGLQQQLAKTFPKNQFALTSDIRRQSETVEFVEIVTDLEKEDVVKQFENIPDIKVSAEPDNILTIRMPQQPTIKFHFANSSTFYHKLFLTTGSSEFIEAFIEKYKLPAEPANEEIIFTNNNLAYIPPFIRETKSILEIDAKHQFEEIITPKDIKGIIHSHSKWSDGLQTIEQMAKAAQEQGFEYLAISDHSQSAFYANGLTPERIAQQHQEVDALNVKLAPFRIFKSIESDILNDGNLDYNNNVLATFDLVIASVHSNLKMTEEKAMERLLKAITNPYTTILGHMTGRKLLAREGFPVDHKKVIDACADNDVVIEINANPRRLDMEWKWIEYAIKRGVLLSIDPDAHSTGGFNDIYYGVKAAQKGGLTAAKNLSSFSLKEFESFLERYNKKRSKAAL